MKKYRFLKLSIIPAVAILIIAVLLLHPWRRVAVPLKSADAYAFQSDPVSSPRKNLSGALLRMEDLLRALLSYSPSNSLSSKALAKEDGTLKPYLKVFLTLNEEIIAQGLLTRGEIEDFYRQSQSRHLPPPVLARAEKANSAFNSKFSGLNKKLSSASRAVEELAGKSPRADHLSLSVRWKLRDLLSSVSSWNRGMGSDILGSDLPYSSPAYKPQVLASGQMVPAYLGGTGGSPIPGDLEGALGAEITPEIQAKVQELGNQPIEIYEYVKDTMGYEPYYGVMKGALETLRQGSGNDADLASLSIAMYRAAGFQARYVRGIARMPVDRLAAWLGLSADSSAKAGGVGQVLQVAGIPFTPVYVGGKVTGYDVERIWVEVYLPYGEYRGAILNEKAGRMWIPLDPGFKQYGLEGQAIDLLGGMNKTGQSLGEEYLNAATGTTFLQFFRDQATSYLATAYPDLTLDDIKVSLVLKPEHLRLLPNTLPYPVDRVISEYAVLPDELIHQAKVTVFGSGGGEIYERTFKLPELAGKRFTLSYQGATTDDEAVIDSYGGLMSTPPYLVKVTPVLRVNGVGADSAVSIPQSAIGLGIKHSLRLDFISPTGTKRVESEVIAGNYYGLGVAAQRSSFLDPDSFVQCPNDLGGCISSQLTNSPTYQLTLDSGSDSDGLGGRLLYQRAVGYLNQLYADEEEISLYLGVRLIRPEPSLVVVGNELDVTYLSGIPQLIEWKGVRIDATSRPVTPIILSASEGSSGSSPSSLPSNFMLLSGYESSSLENLIFEKDFGVESVSAVKALQLAHAQGMDLLKIDSNNISTQLPLLDASDEVKEDIINKVNQGLKVTVHSSLLTFHSWIGTGYVAIDPETGNAGYFLSGQIAGGMTVWGIELWEWKKRSALSNSDFFGGYTDNTDLAAAILKLGGDFQQGEVGTRLNKPLLIRVVTGDTIPKAVKGVGVVFEVVAGGGYFEGNQTKIVLPTGPDGTVGTYLYPGTDTMSNPVFVYDQDVVNKPEAIQAGLNVVNVYLEKKPEVFDVFQALGLPGVAFNGGIQNSHVNGNACSFNSFFSVSLFDVNGNPVSNAWVNFSVAPVDQGSNRAQILNDRGISIDDFNKTGNALIYKWHEECPVDFPTLETKDTLGDVCGTRGIISKQTRIDGASILTILGNVPDFEYQFRVNIPSLNKIVIVSQFAKPVPGISKDPHPLISPYLDIEYTVPASNLGYPINGIEVETRLKRPVVVTLSRIEELDINKDGLGDGILKIVRLSKSDKGSVDFTPDNRGGPVPKVISEEDGKNKGEYLFYIMVDKPTGENWFNIQGHDLNNNLNSKILPYLIYGVKANIDFIYPQPLQLDRNGKDLVDMLVGYSIEPSGYQAANSQMLIYEGGKDVIWSSPEKLSGIGVTTIKQGSIFNIDSNYQEQLILNLGSSDMEIKSNYMDIQLVSMEITKIDPKLICLDSNGKTTNDITISYEIKSNFGYSAKSVDVEILENGNVIRTLLGSSLSGQGFSILPGGIYLNPVNIYKAQLVLNAGRNDEMISEKIQIEKIIKLEILEPNENPATNNNFAFDSAKPGVCKFSAKGTMGLLNEDVNILWSLTSILGSVLLSNPDPPKGPKVDFSYTGLPQSNSEFGEKVLTAKHPSSSCFDNQTVEIFFSRDDLNNPNGETPNWYYYWNEGKVVSDLVQFEYVNDNDLFGEYDSYNDKLYVGNLAPTENGSITFQNQYITTGPDGIADSIHAGTDIQIIPFGHGNPNSTIITSGPNGILDTFPGGDDQIVGDTITSGANGVAETIAIGDDVQDIAFGQGQPNIMSIHRAPGKSFSTIPAGDDVIVTTGPLTIGGNGEGIDCCAESCSHELFHKWVHDHLLGTEVDSDGDGLPDWYEISSPFNLDPYNPDTYGVAATMNRPEYYSRGDEEFLARVAEESPGLVHPDRDWSNINGKNWGK